jgi:hypothetical protein
MQRGREWAGAGELVRVQACPYPVGRRRPIRTIPPPPPPPTATARSYTWTDPTDFETTNSTYTFNIGVNVQNVPTPCAGLPTAPAYQITNNGGSGSPPVCYNLGTDVTKTLVTTSTLFDGTNPARGWMINYNGGSSVGCQNGRSLSVIFMCGRFPFPAPGSPNAPNNGSFINEIQSCNYEAWSISPYGCPLGECTPPPSPSTGLRMSTTVHCRRPRGAAATTMHRAAWSADHASRRLGAATPAPGGCAHAPHRPQGHGASRPSRPCSHANHSAPVSQLCAAATVRASM